MRRSSGDIGLFLLLAFGFSWTIWIPMALLGVVVRPGTLPTHFGGLLGPWVAGSVCMLASAPKAARAAWLRRLIRLPQGWWGWMLALTPFLLIAAFLVAAAWTGHPIALGALLRFSGLPVLSPLALFVIVLVVNGYGEEAGWRGTLLPRLQARYGAIGGVLAQAILWIAWHAPLFWIVATYRGMGPAMLVFGFGLGLVLGGFVLAQVSAASRGSVLAAALWHTGYNFGTATEGGVLLQAGLSAIVMTWGAALLLWALASPAGRRAITVPDFDKRRASP
ncbi:CPBP family intramembrane metalloprotease [Sphingomonas sp. ABOLE]|uniref:CPBP family intramembrane glutamic endopeptidase n=1 Tax=Sphingomonas sp. ABOLE TaxID=1985878 RepID=UPI000F7D963E|nr:type II CAAX endopeptidase family protein [Sphingomonas sp. ABOLE]RSV41442.1 CPBP family intramembrane metalloprotease [Sphingomonas sp. ABOLE]